MKNLLSLLIHGVAGVALTVGDLHAGEKILAKDPVNLAMGKRVAWHWQTDGEYQRGTPVYLGFDARINAPNFNAGSADALQVRVNRAPVSIDRLVNKQLRWIHGKRSFNKWDGSNNSLMVLYQPWEQSAPDYGRIHRYVFDITNLLDEKGAAEIDFSSIFSAIENSTVEVRDITVTTGGKVIRHPHPVVNEGLYLSDALAPFRNRAIALHAGIATTLDLTEDYQERSIDLHAEAAVFAQSVPATASEDGSIALFVPSFPLVARLNIGLSGSGWTPVGKGWKQEKRDDGAITFSNDRLRVERRVVSTPFGAEIRDRVVNLTKDDLPVGMLYEVELGNVGDLREFRLFGRKREMFQANTIPNRESATVPGGFFRNAAGGKFGLLVEDDALRNQASYLAWDHTFAFGTDLFYLPPDGSHEFRWTITPAGAEGYYDFLNATRARWKTYQEIPGLFGFVYPHNQDRSLTTPEAIRAFFERTGITIPCIPPATEAEPTKGGTKMIYGNERDALVRPTLERVSAFVKQAREAGITYPFLVYTDPHLVRTDGDKTILEELDDSVVLDERGNAVEYREGWLYNILPTGQTKAGARFLQNLATYLDTPGVGGIFLDEWDHSRARFSFNHPDGVTAQLGEDFTLRRKIGIVPLLIRDYQQTVWKQLKAKEAVIYANQFDATEEALKLPIIHFAEPTQHDSYFIQGAQLGRTPLALTVKRSTSPWLDVQEFLKKGILTCFYARRLSGDHLLRHLYPFTARKLGAGYVVGDGRIVTLCSGVYSFGDQRPLRAKVFGGEGGTYLRTVKAASVDGALASLKLELNREAEEVAIVEVVPEQKP